MVQQACSSSLRVTMGSSVANAGQVVTSSSIHTVFCLVDRTDDNSDSSLPFMYRGVPLATATGNQSQDGLLKAFINHMLTSSWSSFLPPACFVRGCVMYLSLLSLLCAPDSFLPHIVFAWSRCLLNALRFRPHLAGLSAPRPTARCWSLLLNHYFNSAENRAARLGTDEGARSAR